MRFKTYIRKFLSTGKEEVVPFEPVHFAEAGVPPSTFSGMPVLEAFQLVNKWNKQTNQKFVYTLAA